MCVFCEVKHIYCVCSGLSNKPIVKGTVCRIFALKSHQWENDDAYVKYYLDEYYIKSEQFSKSEEPFIFINGPFLVVDVTADTIC